MSIVLALLCWYTATTSVQATLGVPSRAGTADIAGLPLLQAVADSRFELLARPTSSYCNAVGP